MSGNRKHRTGSRRFAAVLLTLLLALLTVVPALAQSSSRNGHMSWEEFFSSWSSGAYEDEFDEDGAYEDGSDEDGSYAGGSYKEETESETASSDIQVEEDGYYTSKEEVAAYLHEFGHLPDNYITKKEARKLGWDSSAGNLDEAAPGMSIGGDYFGNYEGLLPEDKDRDYYECDIDYTGGYRGAKRIIFSNDGLIYYTEDHYNTFELLYGEE